MFGMRSRSLNPTSIVKSHFYRKESLIISACVVSHFHVSCIQPLVVSHSSHRSVHIDIHNRKTPTVSCYSYVSFLFSIFSTCSQTFTIKASDLSLSCSILQMFRNMSQSQTEESLKSSSQAAYQFACD